MNLPNSPYAGPDRLPPPDSDLRNQASRIFTFALITDVLIGAAVVSTGFAVYFSYFDGGPAQGTAGPAAQPKKAGLPACSASVRVGPGGISVVGAF